MYLSKHISAELEILSEPNCNPTFPKTALIGAMTGLVVISLFLSIIVTIRIKRRKKTEVHQVDTDFNPVYGTYRRDSMDEGKYGDSDLVEAVKVNDYYP